MQQPSGAFTYLTMDSDASQEGKIVTNKDQKGCYTLLLFSIPIMSFIFLTLMLAHDDAHAYKFQLVVLSLPPLALALSCVVIHCVPGAQFYVGSVMVIMISISLNVQCIASKKDSPIL